MPKPLPLPIKKPPTAVITPQPQQSTAHASLPKLPPLRQNSAPTSMTKSPATSETIPVRSPGAGKLSDNPAKPVATSTVDSLKSENISKTAVSTNNSGKQTSSSGKQANITGKQTNPSDILATILPSSSSSVRVASKEKIVGKESKSISKDKTGFVLPTPKPPTTKPGDVYFF